MIYNYTTCESVIAKIMADSDSTEVRNRTTDIREWIFEAVDKIGAPTLYLDNERSFLIQDNLIPLPADMHALDTVAYAKNEKGPWVIMLPTTKSFKEPVRRHNHNEPLMPRKVTSQSLLYTVNTTRYLEKMMLNREFEAPEYFIKPGWLVTNKSNGFIKLAYKSAATDERGYPLIPDLTSYQEAIYWYVMMKLNFPKYLSGKLDGPGVKGFARAQNVYGYIQQQWNFYRNQAYAEAMMPTAGDMKNIKHNWNKLIPDYDADENFFDLLNKEQKFYNDYYYGY